MSRQTWTKQELAAVVAWLDNGAQLHWVKQALAGHGRLATEDAIRSAYRRAKREHPPIVEVESEGPPTLRSVPNPDRLYVDPEPEEEAPTLSRLFRVAIFGDCHHPFVDKRAWGLALRAVEQFGPSHIVLIGDFADFAAVSFHEKDPSRLHRIMEEAEHVNAALDQLQHAAAKSGAEVVYCEGNHEQRLHRYIASKCAEFDGLVGVKKLLRIEERGITWVPYRKAWRLGKCWFTHDCGHSGMTAAQRSRDSFGSNVVVGHAHNAGISYRADAKGEAHVGMCVGWLGDPEKVDYMHEIALRNWQHGLGLAYIEEATGNCHLSFAPIVEGRIVVEGKLIVREAA